MRLDRYCGDLWRIEEQDRPILEKAEKVCREIEEGCARLGLEVRAGVLEEEEWSP